MRLIAILRLTIALLLALLVLLFAQQITVVPRISVLRIAFEDIIVSRDRFVVSA